MIIDLIERYLCSIGAPCRRSGDNCVMTTAFDGKSYRRMFFVLEGDQIVMVFCSVVWVRWLAEPNFDLLAWVQSLRKINLGMS